MPEADAYFATRPKLAQIGAWASKQSAPLESRTGLREGGRASMPQNTRSASVPRPPNWSGYRLVPLVDRVLAGPAVPAARSHRIPPRSAGAGRGTRRGSIRRASIVERSLVEPFQDRMPNSQTNQPRRTLLLTGASRGHRARDGEAVFGRRLARDHLLAPSVSGKLPVGGGAGGSHPGRSRPIRRQHERGDRRDQAAARQRRTACAGQQRRDLAKGRGRQAALLDRHHARRLAPRVPGEFLRADHAGARPAR